VRLGWGRPTVRGLISPVQAIFLKTQGMRAFIRGTNDSSSSPIDWATSLGCPGRSNH
jgi:hypothetical protein